MSDLIRDISKLHTTELGIERMKKNLQLELNNTDILAFCKAVILDNHTSIYQKGKNWYAVSENHHCKITINMHSYTIITAHKIIN
ncbi:MAG: DUF3781 domain-containing protein [Oscillospiraceae bacterium]|nr:DUF3781 domain-containing protein [Oscillospiraceae bacterium]